jgi:small subunit ribosomal protein S8
MITSPNDTISDMLTRLRNASLRRKKRVLIPKSKLTLNMAKIFQDEGYISLCSSQDPKFLHINLKYRFTKEEVLIPNITGLKRISKPGLRIYTEASKVPKVLGGIGVAIVSTSKGIMSDSMAREHGLGGEVMCFIW